MGRMGELYRQAEEMCGNCIRSPEKCGKCEMTIFTRDGQGSLITVVLKGSNKKILKVEKTCSCGKSFTRLELEKGNKSCKECARQEKAYKKFEVEVIK